MYGRPSPSVFQQDHPPSKASAWWLRASHSRICGGSRFTSPIPKRHVAKFFLPSVNYTLRTAATYLRGRSILDAVIRHKTLRAPGGLPFIRLG